MQQSIGQNLAIDLSRTKWWENTDAKKAVLFQMRTLEWCFPDNSFSIFHGLIEKALGRPVFTHEFALNFKGIYLELIGESDPPTLQQIIDLIPEGKRLLIVLDLENQEGEEWNKDV